MHLFRLLATSNLLGYSSETKTTIYVIMMA